MITQADLTEAIAECAGQRNPSYNTCIKLAALYILQDHLFPVSAPAAEAAAAGSISYRAGTDFAEAINGKDLAQVWPIMDELLESVRMVYAPLYESTIKRLRSI